MIQKLLCLMNTNSLDKKSEQVIIKNMLEFSKNKIFIIVSHNTESLSENLIL